MNVVHGNIVIRLLDLCFAFWGLVLLSPLLLLLYVIGWCTSRSPLFWQERVGRYRKPFVLVKFRTMRSETASIGTHLTDAESVYRFGRFLRRTKLDELPQLWNVLKGEMSLVGPRPCLFNQEDVVRARAERGVFDVRPGITGKAQLSGIDMSTADRLAQVDADMLASFTLWHYFRYLVLTVLGRGMGDRIRRGSKAADK